MAQLQENKKLLIFCTKIKSCFILCIFVRHYRLTKNDHIRAIKEGFTN